MRVAKLDLMTGSFWNLIRTLCLAGAFVFLYTSSLQAQIKVCAPSIYVECKYNNFSPEMYLEIEEENFQVGDIITIDLIAEDFNHINSLQFTLSFNPYMLRFVETDKLELISSALNDTQTHNGNLAFIWFNATGKGICYEPGSTLLRFSFEILQMKTGENLVRISDNLARREAGVSLDISSPTCPLSFEVPDLIIENQCISFCPVFDICQPNTVTGSASIDVAVCGGLPPYGIQLSGSTEITADENEVVNFTLENIFDEEDVLITITNSDGQAIDTMIQLIPTTRFEMETIIQNPSCIDSPDGRITLDEIVSGVSLDFADYEIMWSNNYFNTTEIIDLPMGEYSVTITDPFGCEEVETFTLLTQDIVIENLEYNSFCDEDGKIAFDFGITGEGDAVAQVLVRDQNFANFPNESNVPNKYFNNDIPPGFYTISLFTEKGCSTDTSFLLPGPFSRIGGTVWYDENGDGLLNEDFPLAGIPVSIFACDQIEDGPLGTAFTNEEGNYFFVVNGGDYQIGIPDIAFTANGQLGNHQISAMASLADDNVDNDNNAMFNADDNDYMALTSCSTILCPESITGEFENLSFDMGFTQEHCLDDLEQPTRFREQCETIENDLEIFRICDLNELDGICVQTPAYESVQNLLPICLENEGADNINWFAFMGMSGSYSIEIDQLNCEQGRLGELGIHAGVFKDCAMTQQIWCSEGPCSTENITISSDQLVPGELYYFFIDGCAGSVCEYQVIINCEDCTPYKELVQHDFPTINLCGPESITPEFVNEDGDTIIWPNSIELPVNTSDTLQTMFFTESIESPDCGVDEVFEINIEILPDITIVAPQVTCEASVSSILFSWLPVVNSDEFEIVVTTSQQGMLQPDGLSYLIAGLENDEEVEVRVTAINATPCGLDATSVINCSALPSATVDLYAAGFNIFPNPVLDKLIIQHEEDLEFLVGGVYNSYGERTNIQVAQDTLDVSLLSPGVYFVAIQFEEAISYVKFIKL